MTARSRLALACALALAALGITVSPASAAITHKFQAPSISGPSLGEPFSQPWGLALDSTGNLFVADAEGPGRTPGAVDIFNPLNVFQPPPVNDASVAPLTPFTGPFVRSVAVDNLPGPNQGIVYVAESNGENVDVFKPKVPGDPAGGYELIQERKFNSYVYVAFDNSGGPNSGDLYVISSAAHAAFLLKPEAGGTLPPEPLPPEPGEEQLAAPPGGFSLSECCEGGAGGLAVGPTGKVYLANPAHRAIDVYSAEATTPTVLTSGPPRAQSFEPIAVGVDPSNGNVYAVDAANHVVDEFSPAGRYLGQITQAEPEKPFVTPLGVAVNASGDVYVSDGGAKAVNVYGPDEEELIPPVVSGGATSGLTATEATLEAKVNPNGFAIQFETTYRFEYGTSTAYGTSVPVPDGAIGTGTSDVPVTTHLSGLSPNTTYHWRLVATNANGTTAGPDHTFIYPETGNGGLPDNRAYEMVTPPQKNAALIGGVPFSPKPEIADNGLRVILSAVQCFAGAASCTAVRQSTGTLYAFTRTTGGWVTTPLAPPATRFATSTVGLSNPNTGVALFSSPTAPGGQDDFYARNENGSFTDIGPVTPPEGGPNLNAVEATFLAPQSATADLSRLVFESEPVWPSFDHSSGETVLEYGSGNATPRLVGVTGPLGSTDLISACRTELGGTLSGGHSPQGALSAPNGGIVYFTAGACEGGTGANAAKPVPVREIYARVPADEAEPTVAISEPSAISPAPPNEGCKAAPCKENTSNPADFRAANFIGASADSTKVFFTSSQQLTDEASQDPSESEDGSHNAISCSDPAIGANGCNLYLYDLPTSEGGLRDPEGRNLIDASACGACAGGPRVQGVMAISSDGSHVYFVAKGVLTHTPNAQGQLAQDGAENMYMFERDPSHPQGHLVFIAALPASDSGNWTRSAGEPANVTPDGRFVVFPSGGALTPDLTRTDGAQQIFRYDAQSALLVRISIGAHGFADNGNAGVGDASIVPGNRGDLRAGPGRTDPTMSHDGSYVFFMSPVGLTSAALNDVRIGELEGTTKYAENVYEYHEGNVYLISDGHDAAAEPSEVCVTFSAVCLIGSDATGSNVFFSTADQLLTQDTDTQLDYYDARICTASEPCLKPQAPASPPCLGEECHGTPPATPSLLAPGTASFSGPGNLPPTPAAAVKAKPKPLTRAQKLAKALKACRSKPRNKRHACEAVGRKKYGPKSKKASKRRTRS
jgi:hypothetical protein